VADKPLISLTLGDPTVYGLRAPTCAGEALAAAATAHLHDGYAHSCGLPSARAALAVQASSQLPPGLHVSAADVLMTHGASGALSLALSAIANTGCNVLLPRPGFPLYATLCELHGLEPRYYDCLPERGWQCDPVQLRSLANADTVALVVCNPGNPTGSVYPPEHLRALLDAAKEIGAVVVADEVYADIVWADGVRFVPIAALSADVPVLSCCALSKRFLLPGWRCGWLTVHDRGAALARGGVREALLQLVQTTMGPSVPMQAALPAVLSSTPREWGDSMLSLYRSASNLSCLSAASAPGLLVETRPKGGLYILVKLLLADLEGPCAASDVAFCAELQREEAVQLLPGTVFGAPGRVRLVLCVPLPQLEAAWARIEAFCKRHARKTPREPEPPLGLWDQALTNI